LDTFLPYLAAGLGLFFFLGFLRALTWIVRAALLAVLVAAFFLALSPRVTVSDQTQNGGGQKSSDQRHYDQHRKQRR
jgi:hypothetical protein